MKCNKMLDLALTYAVHLIQRLLTKTHRAWVPLKIRNTKTNEVERRPFLDLWPNGTSNNTSFFLFIVSKELETQAD